MGKRITLNRPVLGKNGFETTVRAEIIGLVGDVRFAAETPVAEPIVYAVDAQNAWSPYAWLAVRTRIAPSRFADEMRRSLAGFDPDQPLGRPNTLEQVFSDRYAEPKFQATLMGAFATIALLLAGIGIYGVNSYAVAQRRHEIGIRMALGASPGKVMREVILRSMKLTLVGIVLGLGVAVAAASALRSVLVGISPTDPVTLGLGALALALASLSACYLPAWRARHVDPAVALRQE